MISRERVLAVFAGEVPDRVPCWLGASPEWKAMAKARAGLATDEELAVFVGDDFRRVFARYAGPPERSPDRAFLHPEATSRTPFGVERTGYGYGQPVSHPLAAARTAADIERYLWPDPAWMDVSHIRDEALTWGGRYAILGGDWSPFYHDAIDLMGMESFMIAMVENPAVVDGLLRHLVDYYFAVSAKIFEAASDVLDVFFIGNDFGTQNGPVVGEALFRRYFQPHLARLAGLGHDFGLRIMMHCCGGFLPLIPAMIEAGLDGLQALQPSARDMAPARLKAAFGGRIVFNGCIDTQLWLIEGTPDLARARTREVLEIMKPGGGYVASPSHDYLLPETQVDNVFALYETVREFGGY